MWFKFPKGVTTIAVERQEFKAEAKDTEGNECFRAPDHFAPKILMLKGFVMAGEMAKDAPSDLPKADPTRDSAIVLLTTENEGLKTEVQNLRTDLGVAKAQITALEGEKTMLSAQLHEASVKLAHLEEDAEERGEAVPSPEAKKK